MSRHLTDDPIDVGELARAVLRSSDGGLVVFSGVVRDHHEGHAVESITYDGYRPMADAEIAGVIEAVETRYPGVRVAVIHRLGLISVGEISVAIACVAAHRAEAFDACREVIDRIKERVPIWKKEKTPDGEIWVGWQK
ncbi:MAG: molybdenum cofactor biosynthesis protein MoaE [Acidobacteriota bacterium]